MVALAHGTGRAHDGPDGEATSEGDEGFFTEATPDLVERIFIVEVAKQCQPWNNFDCDTKEANI